MTLKDFNQYLEHHPIIAAKWHKYKGKHVLVDKDSASERTRVIVGINILTDEFIITDSDDTMYDAWHYTEAGAYERIEHGLVDGLYDVIYISRVNSWEIL